MLESNFRKAVSYASGDFLSFFTRPVSCILLLLAIGSVIMPIIKGMREKSAALSSKE